MVYVNYMNWFLPKAMQCKIYNDVLMMIKDGLTTCHKRNVAVAPVNSLDTVRICQLIFTEDEQ